MDVRYIEEPKQTSVHSILSSNNPPQKVHTRSLPASPKSHAEAGLAGECEISALPVSWDQPSPGEAFPDQPLSSSSPTDRPRPYCLTRTGRTTGPWRRRPLSPTATRLLLGHQRGDPSRSQCHSLIPHSWEPRNGVGLELESLRWRLTAFATFHLWNRWAFIPRTGFKSYHRHLQCPNAQIPSLIFTLRHSSRLLAF